MYQHEFHIAGYRTKIEESFYWHMLNLEENEILHEIFRVVSRFPLYISCYISENQLSLGQCMFFYYLLNTVLCLQICCCVKYNTHTHILCRIPELSGL